MMFAVSGADTDDRSVPHEIDYNGSLNPGTTSGRWYDYAVV